MKFLKFTLSIALSAIFIGLLTINIANAQIQFSGLVSQGEGIAGWNADGSGPEPAAIGHLVPATGFINQYYYGSSHDYITANQDDACFHFLPGMTGFPEFESALTANGFTAGQIKCKYDISSLEDDIEGVDWFFMNNSAYCNYYNIQFVFELDGEPMLSGFFDYSNMYINTLAGNWHMETGYSPLFNIAASGTPAYDVAEAFLNDLDGKEIRTLYEATFGESFGPANGRTGAYYNVINGVLEMGYPQLPFKGISNEHQGFAGWDADGTGPEPYGNGHETQLYYGASLDYHNIDPDPNACLGHFLDGSVGFFNTLLQLQYRGFEIGDLRIKLGLESLGPDEEGEDWGTGWSNYYNNNLIYELDGEPILAVLQDTNKLISMGNSWMSGSSIGMVYDISENASPAAQFVAQSFLKDLGTHNIKTNTDEILFVDLFDGNGRDGGIYEITEGSIVGVHERATFVPEGQVSGTWTAEGSPYYVEGDLTIEDGQTLTIEPGVRVASRGAFPITVQGNVNAEGTAEKPIMFTASNPNIFWDGLDYDATSTSNEASVFDHCIFQYGQAHGGGEYNSGGIFAVRDYNDIEIYNSTFRHSMADLPGTTYPTCGGAIALWNASPFIQRCVFYDNYALEYAGAILVYMGSEPIISNCLFYDNESVRGGALAFYEYSNGILINSTISNNVATEYGGGLYFYKESNPEIINTILWDNEALNDGNEVYFSMWASIPGFYYCDIEGGAEAFGGLTFNGDYLFNIDANPEFEFNLEFPYTIPYESPCWNEGTPDTSAWLYNQYLPETCLCGNTRILDGQIEIGAYERLFTGIKDNNSTNTADFLVYPNPASSKITLVNGSFENADATIEVFNFIGQKVDEFKIANQIEKEIILDISNFKTGTYFCKLTSGSKVYTGKFIKN